MADINVTAAIWGGVIATLGVWWFRFMLKDFMRRQSATTRIGVYALVWLAYFILVMALAAQRSGG